jgi:hypothetical protein
MPEAPVQQPMRQPKNGLGTTGFVLGLVGLIFSPIPFIGTVAWPLVILGLIFSVLGFVRTRSGAATNAGLSIAGMVCSIIGLVVCILWVAVFSTAATDVVNQSTATHSISYDVTGDAKSATIDYSSYSNGGFADSSQQVPLPWHKDEKATGLFTGSTLTVTTGLDGGSVTCKVTVDGVVKKQETATGAGAIASCSNF